MVARCLGWMKSKIQWRAEMTSHLTQSELEALESSDLPKDPPFLVRGVSHTQFSVARHYGGATFNGWSYVYLPATDELIRQDVMKWLKRRRKMESKQSELIK